MNRRDFITTLCVGTAAGLAGCGGQDGGTPTGTEGDGPTSTSTPGSAPTDTQTPMNATGGGGTTTSASVTIGDVGLQSEDNHRMRIEVDGYQGMQGSAIYEGRWHSGDYALTISGGQGATGETYLVDGSFYLVSGGECFPSGGGTAQANTEVWEETVDETEQLQEWADVAATGTDTIDGEEMYVFVVEPDEQSVSQTFTYYISAETGYLRRVESQGLVAEYWDWGNVEPVQAPC